MSLYVFPSFICKGFVGEVLSKAYLLNQLFFLCKKGVSLDSWTDIYAFQTPKFSWTILFKQSQTHTSPFYSLNHN